MQTIKKHDNLIEFIGNYEGNFTYYLAMEILEGNSLY